MPVTSGRLFHSKRLPVYLVIGLISPVSLYSLALLLFGNGEVNLQTVTEGFTDAPSIRFWIGFWITIVLWRVGSSFIEELTHSVFSVLSTGMIASGITLLPLYFTYWIPSLILTIGFTYQLWGLRRCPECRQWNVFNSTGMWNLNNWNKEYRCSLCGYEAWVKMANNRGGGGGAGGGGGGSGGGGGGCGGGGGGC